MIRIRRVTMRLKYAGKRGAATALLVGVLVSILGCQTPPDSTRFTLADFDHMAAAMAQSLLAGDAIQQRGPESPKWVVSIDEVRNLTNDVITPAEQWSIMYRIRDAQPIQRLWGRKNIRFVLPPEKVKMLREQGFAATQPFAAERAPTHTLTAIFRSATRAQAKARTEVYYAQFALMDLRSGEPVWSDRIGFKRQARGHIWD